MFAKLKKQHEILRVAPSQVIEILDDSDTRCFVATLATMNPAEPHGIRHHVVAMSAEQVETALRDARREEIELELGERYEFERRIQRQ